MAREEFHAFGIGTDERLARRLAAYLRPYRARVAVGETAPEGGAWGRGVLAAYLRAGAGQRLAAYLDDTVFPDAKTSVIAPEQDELDGFAAYLTRYEAGLAIERAATDVI